MYSRNGNKQPTAKKKKKKKKNIRKALHIFQNYDKSLLPEKA
jgi:hypothetical protein